MKAYFKIIHLSMLVFFCVAMLLPSLNEHFHLIAEKKGNENRTKAKKPSDSLGLESYIKSYDTYYSDNFNLRDNLIALHNKLEFSVFDVSPVPDNVIIGKEGWFYNKNCVPNYKGLNLFSREEMIRLKNELEMRTAWAAARNIHYYLAVVPNKMTVYPEYLPNSVIKLSDKTRYDQVISLDHAPDINVIDVRSYLLKHKNDGRYLYQHTDDHWNDLGAYYGYAAILDRLSQDFPELKVALLKDYMISTENREGNMAQMMSLEKEYPEKFVRLAERKPVEGHDGIKRGYPVPDGISDWDYEIVKVNEKGKNLKCLVIRDSYTLLLVRYLQEHFRESVFIHSQWKYEMHEELILKEKPDIVINIMVETGIDKLLEFPFTPPKDRPSGEHVTLLAPNGKYVCSERDRVLIANRDVAAGWETFTLIRPDPNHCRFLSYEDLYLSLKPGGKDEITSGQPSAGNQETFEIVTLPDGYVAFKAANGKYLALDEKSLLLLAGGTEPGRNEKFRMSVVK